MINILEILKKIPNLEDYVFYSPLYGDVKVRINSDYDCPIYLYASDVDYNDLNKSDFLLDLTKEGYYDNISFGERECMLYPSRQNRDWSIFKIPRKDLPKGTNVMYCTDPKIGWSLGKYYKNSKILNLVTVPIHWEYIVPVNKFNFEDWTFNECDNYGTKHKE